MERENLLSSMEQEVYQIEPLKLKIEQYKQLIETIEEDIKDFKNKKFYKTRKRFEKGERKFPADPEEEKDVSFCKPKIFILSWII